MILYTFLSHKRLSGFWVKENRLVFNGDGFMVQMG